MLENAQGVFSSVGLERYLDRVEVTGSNPVTPTQPPSLSEVFLYLLIFFRILVVFIIKSMKMKCFEYKVLKDKVFRKSLITEEELNRLGKQGWELVSISAIDGIGSAFFKREL